MTENVIRSAVVTGPTGVVGTALVRHLLQQGIRVYAVVRPDSCRIDEVPDGAILVRCNLSEIELLPQLIPEPVDAFFHLAWANTIGEGRNDMPAQIENIHGAIMAVRAAAELHCNVFMGAGSQAEYGPHEGILTPDTPCVPRNGYGMAKLCAGQMTRVECQKLGIRHVWIRILSVYGPGDGPLTAVSMMFEQLAKGESPKLTAGEQKWDYLYSADAARALLLAAERGKDGAVYPLGSGRVRPLREYFIAMRDIVAPDVELALGALDYAPGQVMHLQADLSMLTKDTGFMPQYSFEDGIREIIEQQKRGCKNGK